MPASSLLPPPRPAAQRSAWCKHRAVSASRAPTVVDQLTAAAGSEEGEGKGGAHSAAGWRRHQAVGRSPPARCSVCLGPAPRQPTEHAPRRGLEGEREGQGCRCAQSLQAWRIGLQSSGMLFGRAQCLSAALPPRLDSACWKHLLWTVQRIHASHSASSWQDGAVVVGGSVPASLLPALLGAGSIALSQEPEPGGGGPYRRASAKCWRCSRCGEAGCVPATSHPLNPPGSGARSCYAMILAF